MKILNQTYVVSGDVMKKSIFQLMLILLLLIVLWYGKSNFESSKKALVLWFETLVPSMLCVMVLVRVIFAYGGLALIAKPFAFFLAKPLNMSRKSFVYVMAMLLLGFPAGAAFINEEVKKGCLHQKEGERLLYACSFATPGFIIMTLGNAVFHDIKIGLFLFAIQFISGLLLLFITRKQPIDAKPAGNKQEPVFARVLAQAIKDSGITLYLMGGYLMLCMSCIPLITQLLPELLELPLTVISEFSSGCIKLASLPLSDRSLTLLIAMLLSFGGFCVHMQIMCMSEAIAPLYHKYLCCRILQVLLSALLILSVQAILY